MDETPTSEQPSDEIGYPHVPAASTGLRGAYAAAWKPVQAAIRSRIVVAPLDPLPRFVCGADCAFGDDRFATVRTKQIFASAVVWDRIEQRIVEQAEVILPLEVPYIPTFLSFREGPALEAVIGRLTHPFGVIFFDGQGMAHPRRCGVASHVGVRLNVPSVGIAKSILCGEHAELGTSSGSTADLIHQDEVIGRAVRTRDGVKPIYISVGHRVDLDSSVALALACVTRYRIPEPTRIADIAVAKLKAREKTLGAAAVHIPIRRH